MIVSEAASLSFFNLVNTLGLYGHHGETELFDNFYQHEEPTNLLLFDFTFYFIYLESMDQMHLICFGGSESKD